MARIKSLGVDHVYCWHALFGYWGGLHPDAKGMKKYRPVMTTPKAHTRLASVEPSQAWDPITLGGIGQMCENAEDLGVFYEELHAYLARSGVDGVKVDGQAVVGGLGRGHGGGPALAKKLHEMLERSVRTHFPTNGLINCMCHSSENILRFSESNLARVSDDTPRTAPATPYTSPTSVRLCLHGRDRHAGLGHVPVALRRSRRAPTQPQRRRGARVPACTSCGRARQTRLRLDASWCFRVVKCCARRCPGVRRATASSRTPARTARPR